MLLGEKRSCLVVSVCSAIKQYFRERGFMSTGYFESETTGTLYYAVSPSGYEELLSVWEEMPKRLKEGIVFDVDRHPEVWVITISGSL